MSNHKKGVTEQEIIDMVKERMKKFEPQDVFFVLKSMGLRYIRRTTVNQVRVCLALNDLGLPITSYTLTMGTPSKMSAGTYKLHNLGDRNILTLIRDGKGKTPRGLRWVIRPEFQERFKGKDHVET